MSLIHWENVTERSCHLTSDTTVLSHLVFVIVLLEFVEDLTLLIYQSLLLLLLLLQLLQDGFLLPFNCPYVNRLQHRKHTHRRDRKYRSPLPIRQPVLRPPLGTKPSDVNVDRVMISRPPHLLVGL